MGGAPLTDVKRGAVQPVDLAGVSAKRVLGDVRRGREVHHHEGVHAAREAEGREAGPFALGGHLCQHNRFHGIENRSFPDS